MCIIYNLFYLNPANGNCWAGGRWTDPCPMARMGGACNSCTEQRLVQRIYQPGTYTTPAIQAAQGFAPPVATIAPRKRQRSHERERSRDDKKRKQRSRERSYSREVKKRKHHSRERSHSRSDRKQNSRTYVVADEDAMHRRRSITLVEKRSRWSWLLPCRKTTIYKGTIDVKVPRRWSSSETASTCSSAPSSPFPGPGLPSTTVPNAGPGPFYSYPSYVQPNHQPSAGHNGAYWGPPGFGPWTNIASQAPPGQGHPGMDPLPPQGPPPHPPTGVTGQARDVPPVIPIPTTQPSQVPQVQASCFYPRTMEPTRILGRRSDYLLPDSPSLPPLDAASSSTSTVSSHWQSPPTTRQPTDIAPRAGPMIGPPSPKIGLSARNISKSRSVLRTRHGEVEGRRSFASQGRDDADPGPKGQTIPSLLQPAAIPSPLRPTTAPVETPPKGKYQPTVETDTEDYCLPNPKNYQSTPPSSPSKWILDSPKKDGQTSSPALRRDLAGIRPSAAVPKLTPVREVTPGRETATDTGGRSGSVNPPPIRSQPAVSSGTEGRVTEANPIDVAGWPTVSSSSQTREKVAPAKPSAVLDKTPTNVRSNVEPGHQGGTTNGQVEERQRDAGYTAQAADTSRCDERDTKRRSAPPDIYPPPHSHRRESATRRMLPTRESDKSPRKEMFRASDKQDKRRSAPPTYRTEYHIREATREERDAGRRWTVSGEDPLRQTGRHRERERPRVRFNDSTLGREYAREDERLRRRAAEVERHIDRNGPRISEATLRNLRAASPVQRRPENVFSWLFDLPRRSWR